MWYSYLIVVQSHRTHSMDRRLSPQRIQSSQREEGEGSGCANPFLKRRGFQIVKCRCGGRGSHREIPTEEPTFNEAPSKEPQDWSQCDINLFPDFTVQDLTSAKPPSKKEVYLIAIKKRNENTLGVMIDKAEPPDFLAQTHEFHPRLLELTHELGPRREPLHN